MQQPTIGVSQATTPSIHHHAPLTSAEIAILWCSNAYYSMIRCFVKHFLNTMEDPDLRDALRFADTYLVTRVNRSSEILKTEGQPIPQGFGDEDVDVAAPRLFTDLYYYYWALKMSKLGLPVNGMNLSHSVRIDVRDYYQECTMSTMTLYNRLTELMLEKGIYIRPPIVNTYKEADIVKKQNFLRGFLGERRPLLAQEVDQLFFGIRTNEIGGALLTGFQQTARSEQVRAYMKRGAEIARKHVKIFSSVLQREEIPIPMHSGELVTDSTIPPFSDRLMMEHVAALGCFGVGDYATAMTSSLRHDLSASYARLMAEAANYGEDGINIMIENGWFEEPPRIVDKREISKELMH